MNIRELVNAVNRGEIKVYDDLIEKYGLSQTTLSRRFQKLGIVWSKHSKTLELRNGFTDIPEEYAEMNADDFFKTQSNNANAFKSKSKSNGKHVNAYESIQKHAHESKQMQVDPEVNATMHSSARAEVSATKNKENHLDVFDMLLKPQTSTKPKRVSRSFYLDHDVLEVLDNMKNGNKSDFVNEALRHVLKMKGIL